MKKTILYFYPSLSSFIKKDISYFEKEFSVIKSGFLPKRKIYTLFLFIKQFLFLVFNIRKSNIIICKFASYLSLLPALFAKTFNKPFIIINGGNDCVSFPSINYGNFNKYILGKFTKWTYHLSSHIVTLHKALIECEYLYQDNDFKNQGFKCFCKNLNKPITEIHNGYDAQKWFRDSEKIPKTFVSVAFNIGDEVINNLKGIDLIFEIAPEFPDCKFYLIGANKEFIDKPKNIIFLPPLSTSELRDFFSKTQFYFQLSLSEGFPNSLCEAMLCECIPIVSNVQAIPAIVNNTAFVLMKKNKNDLVELINKALNSDVSTLQQKARNRIATEFTEEKRKEKLLTLINNLIK